MNIEEAKMQNYKIKVANEAESKEAQELLFALGYSWGDTKEKVVCVLPIKFLFITVNGGIYRSNANIGFAFEDDDGREITLPQLRDLVVLHRNDVSDATHESDFVGHKFFVASDNKAYEFRENKWQPKICKSFLELIVKQEPQMTWQDALRAVADGKAVEVKNISWFNAENLKLEQIKQGKEFRLALQRKTLNGNFTKEELLKIVGEMG